MNPFGSFWRRSISVGSEHFNLKEVFTIGILLRSLLCSLSPLVTPQCNLTMCNVHPVPKFRSCHKAIMVATGRAHCIGEGYKTYCFTLHLRCVWYYILWRGYSTLDVCDRLYIYIYIALLDSHALRTKNIHCVLRFVLSVFVSRAIHGPCKFDRIAYHQYVNIYAVHQLHDSWTIVSRPLRVVRVVLSRLNCCLTDDM